jgi:hypothetical protein
MAYSDNLTRAVTRSPITLGSKLGRLAVLRGFSVVQVALHTGASRTTVYSWFTGGHVSNAYRPAVQRLIITLETKKRLPTTART